MTPLFDPLAVNRGPYLQPGPAPLTMNVMWRCPTVACGGVVKYGVSSVVADMSLTAASGPSGAVNQVATLTGLTPSITYYYVVLMSGSGLAASAVTWFKTPPVTGDPAPVRVWAFGDSGVGGTAQASVRDSYLSANSLVDTDVVVMLGDFAYERGTDAEFQAKYFGMYPTVTRSLPVWPVFGNHDGQSANSNSQTGPYYNIFSPPRAGQHGGVASGTEAYYSFDYGSVHFCVLNSFDVSRYASGGPIDGVRVDCSACDWSLVDAPVYCSACQHAVSNGSGSAASQPYRKPAGFTPHAGTVYVVAGSGGKLDPLGSRHAAMYYSVSQRGSLILDVSPSLLSAQFMTSTGTVIDRFDMEKSVDTVAPSRPFCR